MSVDQRTGSWWAGRSGQEWALLGCQTERPAVDLVPAVVRTGFSGTLVLRGAPEVGKRTMLALRSPFPDSEERPAPYKERGWSK
jgi:hypothetical protein